MEKTGTGALITGLIICAIGGYAIWAFLPEVVAAVKGLIGIAALFAGLLLIIFGILILKD
jgi:hypothetical protein